MAEVLFNAIKGILQMSIVPGSVAAGIVMQMTCFAALALAIRAFRRIIKR